VVAARVVAARVIGARVVGAVVGPPAERVLGAVPLVAVAPAVALAAVVPLALVPEPTGEVAAVPAGWSASRGWSTVVGAASGAWLVVGVVAAGVELAGGRGCAVAVLPALRDEPPHELSTPQAASDVVRATAMNTPFTCILR
jgi:hypothetical protein